ncbi:nicotinate mononucleotide-dependent phosphoribosyltransferase CobT [Candidatus Nitrosocosmicus arcticus]|uniref:nicotinate mononucleotide-dependent phosphoribosyltransferase CobT n=1 Tax=Candidatus Nitrosocosmicus arcticus TaxID=2035267 RepID=UPI00164672DC|nr:TIGR00303 family protein [Candidatus Nitrosocosmicus arcticus]
MITDVIQTLPSKRGKNDLLSFKSNRTSFILAISYTETSTIPGLTVAGANTELLKYTPAADAEYIYYGKCKCIDTIPATPDGKPTPAIISKTALDISNIPISVVDSGSKIKPILPYVNINSEYGKNIIREPGLGLDNVMKNYDMGKLLGKELAKINETVIVGESIPGGTTTALGVMQALGIEGYGRVSSSMPDNPNELKNKIIEKALSRSKMRAGDCSNDPFRAIANMGDPLMPTVVGLAEEIISREKKIILAGGTQMCCILALLKSLNIKFGDNICIGTTSYIINDKKSDIVGLMNNISDDVPIFYIDLLLENSTKKGLRSYSEGFVKEGAGAGGSSIAAFLNSEQLTKEQFLHKIEENYIKTIEKPSLVFTNK